MAIEPTKQNPDGVPIDPGVFGVAEAEDISIEKDEARVRLFISGGLRGQEYLFDLDVDSSGHGSFEMSCDISKRCAERQEIKVEASEIIGVLRAFEPAFASREILRQGGFPPCSLIGRLEVEIGGRLFVQFFMADPAQAETAGYRAPPFVIETTEALYRMAERQLGIENVRP